MKKVFKAIKAYPLTPSLSLLCKLGSVVVHAQELFSPDGHIADRAALETLFEDAELQEWIKSMGVYMPVKR